MNREKIKELEQMISSDYDNMLGLMVQKNGVTVYENYFNGYTSADACHIYSVTKSVFGTLIGIAIEEGFIRDVHQRVLDFFPDYQVLEGETTIQKITIEHLLTMTAPYKYDEEPYLQFFASENPIKDALDLLGGEKPIGVFNYSGIGGTHILSGILRQATGQSILDYARKHLFIPMDINVEHDIELHDEQEHITVMNDKNTTGWVIDPQGNNMASWGLFLTPAEMAKIGQLYINHGMWNGRQLVPARWINECTKIHSRWNGMAYGYLWWIIDEQEHAFAALGDGGNVIYANETKQLVIASTGFFMPEVKDRLDLIQQVIEPVFAD